MIQLAPGRVQARLWSALTTSAAPETAARLSQAAGTSFQTAEFRLKAWVRAGLVERSDRRPRHYRLLPSTERTAMPPIIDPQGRALSRPAPAYQRLWRVIRVLKTFDLPQLRLTAGAPHRTVLNYVGLLQQVGYVRLQKLGNPRTGEFSRYVLVRNTGPRAPRETIVRREGENRRLLVDNNIDKTFDVSRGAVSARRKYGSAASAAAPVSGGKVNHVR